MITDTEKVVLFSVLYVMVQIVLNYIGIEKLNDFTVIHVVET